MLEPNAGDKGYTQDDSILIHTVQRFCAFEL
jgi:hypothetical protein